MRNFETFAEQFAAKKAGRGTWSVTRVGPSRDLSTMIRMGAAVLALGFLAIACGSNGDETGVTTTIVEPGTSGAATTPAEITVEFLDGRWRGEECGCTIVFDDGTYEVIVVGATGLQAADRGSIELADGLVTFVSSEDSPKCAAGDEWVSRYAPLRPSDAGADRIQLTPVSDDCGQMGWYEQLARTS